MSHHTASCHCGAVELAVEFPDGISAGKRCNCSICRRKGAVMVYTAAANVKVTRGAENLSTYSFHSHTAQHYFCKTCGIYTHHRARFDPEVCGINAGCIEGLDIDTLTLTLSDGTNHPSDVG